MINDIVTTKALLDKIEAFATLNNYGLSKQGFKFTPEPTETYLRETFLPNVIDPLGLSATSSDRQDPIYQIDIYTAKGQGGPWPAREIVNLIKAEFPKYSFVVNTAEQKVQVYTISGREMTANDTHNWTMVNIELIVMASNT